MGAASGHWDGRPEGNEASGSLRKDDGKCETAPSGAQRDVLLLTSASSGRSLQRWDLFSQRNASASDSEFRNEHRCSLYIPIADCFGYHGSRASRDILDRWHTGVWKSSESNYTEGGLSLWSRGVELVLSHMSANDTGYVRLTKNDPRIARPRSTLRQESTDAFITGNVGTWKS